MVVAGAFDAEILHGVGAGLDRARGVAARLSGRVHIGFGEQLGRGAMEFAHSLVAVAIAAAVAAAVRLAVLAGFDLRHRGLRTGDRCALGRSASRLVVALRLARLFAGLRLARLRGVRRHARVLARRRLQCGQRVRLRRAGFRHGGSEDERLNDRYGRSLRDDRGRGGGIDEHGIERGH